MNQWNNYRGNESITESMIKWISEPTNQWSGSSKRWTNESVKQPINESLNQWIKQSMNQWTNESMKQWNNELRNRWKNEPINAMMDGTCLVLFVEGTAIHLLKWEKKHHDRSAKDVNGNNTSLYFDAVTVLNVLYNTWLTASDIIGLLFIRIQVWSLKSIMAWCRTGLTAPETRRGSKGRGTPTLVNVTWLFFWKVHHQESKTSWRFQPRWQINSRSVKWDHPGTTEKVQTINQKMPNTW